MIPGFQPVAMAMSAIQAIPVEDRVSRQFSEDMQGPNWKMMRLSSSF
jgi:hypothetical protein